MTSDLAAPGTALAEIASAGAIVRLPGLLDHCRVEGFEADFTSWGFYEPEPWRNYWHRHSFYEVCLCYAGTGRFSHGDDEYTVGPGQLFLARPGVVHEIESDPDDPLGIAFWGFGLLARSSAPRIGSRGWWTGLDTGPVVSRRLGSIPALLSALATEADRPRSGHRGLCRSLGAALIIETGRAFADDSVIEVTPVRQQPGQQAYALMHRYLRDNLARPITVREVAAAVHLSQRHAERLFIDNGGRPMMATLRELRMASAAQLLLEDRTVTETAAQVGYGDLPSFRAAFRSRYGQSPVEFRRTRGTRHEAD
ncbi:AraC family transcriptional regulator [Microlunatus elymi]|uniref:AraC family transcriptional regulator n=1 Tax=Microlunatus elymi TaxID=2596828 RepID=A0A516Q4B2_9ACTN|nr:AraC family transcriptional regulator [Microlunatus elymi]QDP98051.1 AraC family transcriptional regulator [Microlunatus elymi]